MKSTPPGPRVAQPSPLRRAWQLLALDRQDILVIVIYGIALGLLSLAVPVAVQSLVNTVAFGSLIQPLVVLTILLAVALIGAAILRALQVRITEMLQRRLFVRIVTEIGGRLPRVSAGALRAANGPE
ncbi:MAG: ABC transporter ATP-binding protein, partial [Myxococcales bacterium]|nr:ABC transporter ATP-binding protein [Myxococcales bacterium]